MPLIKLEQILLSFCKQVVAQSLVVPDLANESSHVQLILKLLFCKVTHFFELLVSLGIEAWYVSFQSAAEYGSVPLATADVFHNGNEAFVFYFLLNFLLSCVAVLTLVVRFLSLRTLFLFFWLFFVFQALLKLLSLLLCQTFSISCSCLILTKHVGLIESVWTVHTE